MMKKHYYSSKVTKITVTAEQKANESYLLDLAFKWASDTVATITLKTKPQVLIDFRSIIKFVNHTSERVCSAALIRGIISGEASHTTERYLVFVVEEDI